MPGEGKATMADKKGAARFPDLAWLIGSWRGYGQFSGRTTYITKQFAYALDGITLVERTLSVFPPAEPDTEYEVHLDEVHYFRSGEDYEAIGFYVEGFVNFFHVSAGRDPLRIEAESYQVKNAPEGLRAKIIYQRQDDGKLTGEFQLAGPQEPLATVEVLQLEKTS